MSHNESNSAAESNVAAESNSAAQIEPDSDPPVAESTADGKIFDDDSDIEDLEFLIDDIEDQIAPLG